MEWMKFLNITYLILCVIYLGFPIVNSFHKKNINN